MPSSLKYLGVGAAVYAWALIFACLALNPWFVFTHNAFSDLGGSRANYPWLYNYGLISVAFLICVYSVYLVAASISKGQAFSSALVFTAGIFLALIGVYHEGTYPHVFVSTWFFVQFDLAIASFGAASLVDGRRNWCAGYLALALAGTGVAEVVHWPSAATLEAWGIVVIDAWAVLTYFSVERQGKQT